MCDRLAGVVAPETEVAVVQQHFHVWEVLEADPDAFVACGGRIAPPSRLQGVGPERAALAAGDDGGLHGVLLLLARDERPATAAAGCGTSDLHLGGIQPQFDAPLGLGVSEYIRQGPQPQAGPVGNRASSSGPEPAYLSDRAGDGGAVGVERQGEDRVREIVRRWISVTTSRSTNTSRWRAPAPASRFLGPPRAS